jgi:hypothetical protein
MHYLLTLVNWRPILSLQCLLPLRNVAQGLVRLSYPNCQHHFYKGSITKAGNKGRNNTFLKYNSLFFFFLFSSCPCCVHRRPWRLNQGKLFRLFTLRNVRFWKSETKMTLSNMMIRVVRFLICVLKVPGLNLGGKTLFGMKSFMSFLCISRWNS